MDSPNPCHSLGTFEIWGALLNGGSVEILPQEVALSPPDLAEDLRRRPLDALFLTTSLFHQVVRRQVDALAGVPQVLAGGEALDPAAARSFVGEVGPNRLLNMYGPTESTTFATQQVVGEVSAEALSIPIGRPIANTRVRELDRQGHPVPLGVTGQLMIGGAGLARGYMGRPGLTAEHFVPDGVSTVAGERLYATGDLVRRLADGRLDFLGRLDDQVKIRGFRIEPGEVEAALMKLERVSGAAVLVAHPASGDLQLVAYVVLSEPASLEPDASDSVPAELRDSLSAVLPDFLVPSAFVLLDELPLTANGKLDRAALPDAGGIARQARRPYLAPRSGVEEFLVDLWREILGAEKVGVHDGFFELGGHSLLATQVMAQIRTVLRVDLPLRRLFETSNIAELAAAILKEEPVPGQAEKLARLLLQVKRMSAEETGRQLKTARK